MVERVNVESVVGEGKMGEKEEWERLSEKRWDEVPGVSNGMKE